MAVLLSPFLLLQSKVSQTSFFSIPPVLTNQMGSEELLQLLENFSSLISGRKWDEIGPKQESGKIGAKMPRKKFLLFVFALLKQIYRAWNGVTADLFEKKKIARWEATYSLFEERGTLSGGNCRVTGESIEFVLSSCSRNRFKQKTLFLPALQV